MEKPRDGEKKLPLPTPNPNRYTNIYNPNACGNVMIGKPKIDGINQLEEETAYKKEHKELALKLSEFKQTYHTFKTSFFEHIKTIMKEEKQQRLLD